MRVTKEIDISASPANVYEYLIDFPRHSEWTTPEHRVQIKPDDVSTPAVGSRFESDAHQFGSQHDILTLIELVPDRRIVYTAEMKDGSTFRHTFELTPDGAGTHLSKKFETVHLTLINKLTAPIAGALIVPKVVQGDVRRIKARLEQ